jgi:hypothetical protein
MGPTGGGTGSWTGLRMSGSRLDLGTAHDNILRVCACKKSYTFDLCDRAPDSTTDQRVVRVLGSIGMQKLSKDQAKSA